MRSDPGSGRPLHIQESIADGCDARIEVPQRPEQFTNNRLGMGQSRSEFGVGLESIYSSNTGQVRVAELDEWLGNVGHGSR